MAEWHGCFLLIRRSKHTQSATAYTFSDAMNPVILLVKTGLKSFWDIDPVVVDGLLLHARVQAVVGWNTISQTPTAAGRIFRAAVHGVSAEVQSLLA